MDNTYLLEGRQAKLLEMLVSIDSFCHKHDIKYSLIGGSLLGAVRNKGFIPWDDDADILMRREDYQRFLSEFSKNEYNLTLRKICNLTTLSIVTKEENSKCGDGLFTAPWVTVFVADNAPDNKLCALCKAFWLRLLQGMMGKPPQYKAFPIKSKMLFSFTAFLGFICGGKERAAARFNRLTEKDNNISTKYFSIYNLTDKSIFNRYDNSILDKLSQVEFEGKSFFIVSDYDSFLKVRYGDYMTPVDLKHRYRRHT